MKGSELARLIDHTLLKPEATPADIQQLCEEALEYRFACVCINPVYVPMAAAELAGTDVEVGAAIGFPLGATTTTAKVCEAKQALDDGATELDMVIHIGALKAGERDRVVEDVAAVAAVCHEEGALLKVIIEAALLDDDEKVEACEAAEDAGADFVKTSTRSQSNRRQRRCPDRRGRALLIVAGRGTTLSPHGDPVSAQASHGDARDGETRSQSTNRKGKLPCEIEAIPHGW